MSKLIFSIHQGDTGPHLRPRPAMLADGDVITPDWELWSTVVNNSGGLVVSQRQITDLTDDSMRWEAALLPSETALLQPPDWGAYGAYTWALEIRNATWTPRITIERHILLKVLSQAVG